MHHSVVIEIAAGCNAKCPWCVTGQKPIPSRGKTKFIEVALFSQALDRLIEIGIIHPLTVIVLFNWGEPTLHPQLNDILWEVKKRNLRFDLSTNGSIPFQIDPAVVPNLRRLFISMPGFSQASYDRIHGFDFAKIIRNIDTVTEDLRKAGFPKQWTEILFHVYQFNLNEIKKAMLHFADQPVKMRPYLAFPHNYEQAADYLAGRLAPELLKKMGQDMLLYYVDDLVARSPKNYRCPQYDFLTIDEEGRLNTCCTLPRDHPAFNLGSIFSLSADEIQQLKQSQEVCRECLDTGLAYWLHQLQYVDLLLNPFVMPESGSTKPPRPLLPSASNRQEPIQLSICIPTRNRHTLLAQTLDQLSWIRERGLPIEIIVSDNASTDDTERVIRTKRKLFPHFRSIQHNRDVGLENNLVAALRAARGKYTVYLADDDHLLPDNLLAELDYLEQNQEIVASYSPWWRWYDGEGLQKSLSYSLEQPLLFGKKESLDLFNFLNLRRIWPRMAIYRTEFFSNVLFMPHGMGASFVWLFRLLQYGRIRFQPQPFYVQLAQGAVSPAALPGGRQKSWSRFALDREGLEMALSLALSNAGVFLPVEGRGQAVQLIHNALLPRLDEAARISRHEGDFISAHEFLRRQLVWNDNKEVRQEIRQSGQPVVLGAAMQALGELFSVLPETHLLVFCDTGNDAVLQEKFREQHPQIATAIRDTATALTLPDRYGCLYLTGREESRAALREDGIEWGKIVLLMELVRLFQLSNG